MARLLTFLMFLAGAAYATAQQQIQWMTNPQQAVALAQQKNRPLMVWVRSSRRNRGERLERDQKRAFKDPRVVREAQNFVALRLSRTVHRDLLDDFGLPQTADLEMSFVMPGGEKLSGLSGGAVAQAESLADKLRLVFQEFGRRVYKKDIEPVLEDKEAKPAALQAALKLVDDLRIQAADKGLAELLDRERLDRGTRKLACQTLAHLSTKVAVEKLLELAGTDAIAAGALPECTPAGADLMLGELNVKEAAAGEEPKPFNYLVYRAVTRICRVPKPKPESYFEKAPADRIAEEVQRVSNIVRDVAKRWKEEYE